MRYSYITSKQVQVAQIARRAVEKLSNGVFDEAQYQITLAACKVPPLGGRRSCKHLSQAGFEKFMAIMEGMGFRQKDGNSNSWRSKNSVRTGYATTRQVFEIRRLAPCQEYPTPGPVLASQPKQRFQS